jgi:hypothetical protein
MRFYYFSLFSWMAYVVLASIGIVLLWFLWTKALRLKVSNPVYWVLLVAIVVAPWTEELWIAYNFDRLCRKDAGVFINKTVEVDGFYDDTTGWGPRQLSESGYRFMESKDILAGGRLMRVERAGDAMRDRAIAWYTEKNPDKPRPDGQVIVQPISEREQVVVSPNGVDAWQVRFYVKVSARYHYKRTVASGTPVAHRITRSEDVVVDNETSEVLGRYADYGRGPYWFFISLGAPTIPCEETLAGTRKYGSLIYRAVLKPSK